MSRTRAIYDRQLPNLEGALHSLYQEIRRLLERHDFTPTIKYRVKRFDAYFDKLRKNRLRGTGRGNRSLGDFFALRIICPFLEDIETVERILIANYDVIETERKSTQHSFREFGYDSVHLMIKPKQQMIKAKLPGVRNVCEVQLRTILQDAWAEVEHELVYKSDISLPKESIRRKLASLNATLNLSDLIFQEIRDYQNEIRQHGRMRRSSVLEETLNLDLINIDPPLQNGPKPIASTLKSRLEKTMLRALEAHSSNDFDTAIELYGAILGMRIETPIRALVYNHRGMAFFAQGNHSRALRDFNQAIRYDPTSSRSLCNRGLCNRILKRYDKALEDFETALEIDPVNADCYFGRAQTYLDTGQPELAKNDCRKVLEINPEHQAAHDLLNRAEPPDLS
ncbi:MAG: (p)ppGpp synthetase [Desulfuromonas sp.]|nr:MAG: (p)ppGpp synthetase [Desulfuromonas sp.]